MNSAIQFILKIGFWLGLCLAFSQPFSWPWVLLGVTVTVVCGQGDGAIEKNKKPTGGNDAE